MTKRIIHAAFISALALGSMACKQELPRKRIPIPSSPQALQRGGKQAGGSQIRVTNTRRRIAAKSNAVAGIQWKRPTTWKLGRKRPMRLATYIIPGSQGSPGECSIFYFGSRAGSVQANIERWKGQFKFASPQVAKQSVQTKTQTFASIQTTILSIQGTFMSSVRPMSSEKVAKPNFVMLGAIALAPQGPVFFKCVGPKTTMMAAQSDFTAMLKSIQKGQ